MRHLQPDDTIVLQDFIDEYKRYRLIGERALAQMPDAALNHVPAVEGNSAAMIVFHVSGNLTSRFTDFLTTDGEKPWRTRDDEFADRTCSRAEVDARWAAGWGVLESTLTTLSDADMSRVVTLRGHELTVHAALCRSVAHMAYHVGQIVLLARMLATDEWRWISIPKGGSDAYNAKPSLEKAPK